MKDETFNELTGILEAISQTLGMGVSIIDARFTILWVNVVLQKKGFMLNNVKGSFYRKTFDNAESIDEDDPTYKSVTSGTIIDTVKRGNDNREYRLIDIPVKDSKGNVEFVIEMTYDIDSYNDEMVHKLKDFIIERELKMTELKHQIKALKEG